MDQRTKKITLIASCIFVILGFVGCPSVSSADDISVSGNATNSNNTVNISSSQQATTQQSNTSQTANNTSTSASTGNNTASNNAGGSSAIQTGDATVSTTVNTTANVSTVTQDPANTNSQTTTASITNNGDGSTNTVDVSNTNTTTVSVNQDANITNNVSQKAITGHNSADGNNGNVTIKTGNILAQENVQNGPINISHVSTFSDEHGSVQINISGNGQESVNTVTSNNGNTNEITVTNCTTVINNLKAFYLTGGNSANSNNGQVSILTGNISSLVTVQNGPINVSTVSEKEHTKQTPPAPTPTPQPTNSGAPSSSPSSSPSNSSSSNSSSGGTGTVMGASANNLPVTGNYWFFIALIGNILMMLLGGYLRLHSGRSPGDTVVL